MKKFFLFAATMMLCAGLALAQNPVKKESAKVAAPPSKELKTEKKDCGKCENHKCPNKDQVQKKEDVTKKQNKPKELNRTADPNGGLQEKKPVKKDNNKKVVKNPTVQEKRTDK